MEKIIHQVWVGKYKMPEREREFCQHLKNINNCEYILWTEPDSEMPDAFKHLYERFYAVNDFAFCADLLRIWYVYKHGGFYFDVDWEIKKPIDDFFAHDGVFFYHSEQDHTIPNNIFGSKKGSDVLKYCVNQVTPDYNWYGPSWFGAVVKQYINLEYTSPQKLVKEKLAQLNFSYQVYYEFEKEYGGHRSLYSWSPENKKKFSENEQL